MKLEDTFKHKGLRQKLVDGIRQKGVRNEDVLKAMLKVPRHYFMDSGFVSFAYRDQAFPIGEDQTISQPYTVAFQTELLDVKMHDKVLEIGTGSGYQAAVLLELGVRLFTIERQRKLFLKTQTHLPLIHYKPRFFYGDGYKGLPAFAPFDRILITAAAPEIPGELLRQLKIGGKMVMPKGGAMNQNMLLIEKTGEDEYKESKHGLFVFVPMLNGTSNGKNS